MFAPWENTDNDMKNFKVILIFMKIIQVPYGKCRVAKRKKRTNNP